MADAQRISYSDDAKEGGCAVRLLLAMPDANCLWAIRCSAEWDGWNVTCAESGQAVLDAVSRDSFDVLVLHACLPGMDGFAVGQALGQMPLLCPPRILLVSPPEFYHQKPFWADCVVMQGVHGECLVQLAKRLMQKPLSNLAAVRFEDTHLAVCRFLHEISMDTKLRGYRCASWLLQRLLPSPNAETIPLASLYHDCAQALGIRPAAVERALRIAVENVFTRGNLPGIERCFGLTVDPERGKLTNRAFLLQAVAHLRTELYHSRTDARSPNSSVMHHRPAAPTSV